MKLYIIVITASVLGLQIGMAYFAGHKSPVPRAVESDTCAPCIDAVDTANGRAEGDWTELRPCVSNSRNKTPGLRSVTMRVESVTVTSVS